MASGLLILVVVVATLSVVQSLFGVGLLLFGTPTLLLLGFGFAESIAALLPCSLAIDLLQLRTGLPRSAGYTRALLMPTLPLVGAGLLATLFGLRPGWIASIVGGVMVMIGVLRCSSTAAAILRRLVQTHRTPYMATMGLVHGLTNMGGGMLVMLAGSYTDDKHEIRRLIAAGYSLFACTQLSILALMSPQSFHPERAWLIAAAIAVYLAANRLFYRLSHRRYQHLLTVLILSYGALVIAK